MRAEPNSSHAITTVVIKCEKKERSSGSGLLVYLKLICPVYAPVLVKGPVAVPENGPSPLRLARPPVPPASIVKCPRKDDPLPWATIWNMAVPDLSPTVPVKVQVALVFAVPSACVTVTACPEQVPTKVPVDVKEES